MDAKLSTVRGHRSKILGKARLHGFVDDNIDRLLDAIRRFPWQD
jgi:hypothetical protein